MEILIRERGVVDAHRFLSQFRFGVGDYTKEREQWLDDLSLEQIVSEIKRRDPSHVEPGAELDRNEQR
jgi:hypothetical protein